MDSPCAADVKDISANSKSSTITNSLVTTSLIMKIEATLGKFDNRTTFVSSRCSRRLLISLFFIVFILTFFKSCGEGEDYHQFLNRNLNRHNRRLFRRLNNINHNHLDSQHIIPRQNVRLRALFDRVNLEIEKYRRK